jgi:APA family basic amino acid/polyamine antiporter
MLNYVATIAISAFFVPHYLSVFWEPLRDNPWDIVGGVIVVVLLVLINVVGIQESTRVNVLLAVVDFATQVVLVLIGFVLVFSPSILVDNVHLGEAPTWRQFFLAIPVAMLAYTGVETVSNLAEEARDPSRTVPNAYKLIAAAVFAIYFTLPMIALSAMPVERAGGEFRTVLGEGPPRGFANDPVLGVVKNLGISGAVEHGLEIYVGILAATILFIATNAGVIGASRITYAMATYRQLPGIFRRLHRRFATPWLALAVFAGLAPVAVILPGRTTFLGTIYSFGATLSFTVAHAAIIALRVRKRQEETIFRARPNFRWRGIDWPLFALFGGIGTGLSWLVIVVQQPATRWTGIGWLVLGLCFYYGYRRWFVHQPLTSTVRAPALILGPALQLEYRTIVVPVVRTYESEEALVAAARLATERRATIAVVHVIEVPMDRTLDQVTADELDEADDILEQARGLVETYGVRTFARLVRARRAGPAIVEEAERRNAELIVMGAPRRVRGRRALFGPTVDYVLKASPCRVLLAAGRRAA